jgi:hypothetical protein
MAIYELCIAVADEPEVHPITRTKKEGEIVTLRPYPQYWGRKEIDEYFIVLIESARPVEDVMKLKESTYWDAENSLELSRSEHEAIGASGNPEGTPEEKAVFDKFMKMPRKNKNRFKVNMQKLRQLIPGFSMKDFSDKKVIYQPMKKKSALIEKFTGIRTVLPEQAICKIPNGPLADEDEKIINIDDNPDLIIDQLRGVNWNGE